MFNIGTQELLIILFVVLMLFGAQRIPEVARSLGKGIGDFRDALSGVERELKGEGRATPRAANGAVPHPASLPSDPRGTAVPESAAATSPEPPVNQPSRSAPAAPPGEGTGLAG